MRICCDLHDGLRSHHAACTPFSSVKNGFPTACWGAGAPTFVHQWGVTDLVIAWYIISSLRNGAPYSS
jgi:hypothetical protein